MKFKNNRLKYIKIGGVPASLKNKVSQEKIRMPEYSIKADNLLLTPFESQ